MINGRGFPRPFAYGRKFKFQFAGRAGGQSERGAAIIVFALRRPVRDSCVNFSLSVGRAGGQSEQGAAIIVFALRRPVRSCGANFSLSFCLDRRNRVTTTMSLRGAALKGGDVAISW